MLADPSSPNLPAKKKWETPCFFIIDSNQPEGGGPNNAFVEHSAKSGKYYIGQKGNPGLRITVPKGVFNTYEHS
jgi:hypothetical protein